MTNTVITCTLGEPITLEYGEYIYKLTDFSSATDFADSYIKKFGAQIEDDEELNLIRKELIIFFNALVEV